MPDKNLINKISATLASFPSVKLAILYGSFAKDKETAESDIDLGVAADHILSFEEKEHITLALSDSCGREVDLIDLLKKHEPILTQVLSKGIVVFNHDKHLYAELIKTMMFDQADFMPYRNRILKERRDKWINN
jgi:predicted nucleotidyltransferase